jgi:ABC-2 type transport system permease protein
MTAADFAPPRRSRSAEWSALGGLFALTLRQHTHGRRVYVLALLYLLPCALAILLRSLPHPAQVEALEFSLVFALLPHALAPLTALLYAAGVVADEVEEQTLTYLLLRAVPRWKLYLTKLLATLLVTTVLVTVAVLALYTVIYVGTPGFWSEVMPRALKAVAVTALAQVGYVALFGFLGLFTRRSLIAGVGYIIVIEGILANIDFAGRALTIVYYVRTLALRWLDLPREQLRWAQEAWGMEDLSVLPSAGNCVLTVVGVSLLVSLASARWFARSEYHVKTPGSD